MLNNHDDIVNLNNLLSIADPGRAIVGGATLRCSKGSSMSLLIATMSQSTRINNLPVATILDVVSGVNILPFGTCEITGQPCMPVITTPWIGIPITKFTKIPALSEYSFLPCMQGGIISIEQPLQTTVSIGKDRLIADASGGEHRYNPYTKIYDSPYRSPGNSSSGNSTESRNWKEYKSMTKQQQDEFNKRYTRNLIAWHEKSISRVYCDRTGHPTVGIGFNLCRTDARSKLLKLKPPVNFDKLMLTLTNPEAPGLSESQIEHLLDMSLNDANDDVKVVFPGFERISDPVRRAVLIDMAFRLGRPGLLKDDYIPLRSAVSKAIEDDSGWDDVAEQMRSSPWYRGDDRSNQDIDLMKRGLNGIDIDNERNKALPTSRPKPDTNYKCKDCKEFIKK